MKQGARAGSVSWVERRPPQVERRSRSNARTPEWPGATRSSQPEERAAAPRSVRSLPNTPRSHRLARSQPSNLELLQHC
jgi:hypothetical protein